MSLQSKNRITFITPYPIGIAPGQRFRFEQYLKYLESNNFSIKLLSFLSRSEYDKLYKNGFLIHKILMTLKGYLKRILHTFSAIQADYIFLFREASPLGPPIFEWILAKVFSKKIIYDFDDAIWLTDRRDESFLFRTLKWRSKVSAICKWSYKVSCGNKYLASYASQFNNSVIVNPTTIDTENHHNQALYKKVVNDNKKSLVIGWTGSHSTLKYLRLLEPVFQMIELKYPQVTFLIIADRQPELKLSNLKFLTWSAETEIQDLLQIDIGIMPLPDDEWSKGKCGFKALQYMALEIPAVVSPVGVNSEIITNGIEGFLCTTEQEWLDALERLIVDQNLRDEMGSRGREKVIQNYSVISNSSNFLSLFT